MDVSLLDSLKERLKKARPGTVRKISESTGFAYDTIHRIKRGWIPNPGIRTVEKISAALKEIERTFR